MGKRGPSFHTGWSGRPHGKVTHRSRPEGTEGLIFGGQGVLGRGNRKCEGAEALGGLRWPARLELNSQAGLTGEAGLKIVKTARRLASDTGWRARASVGRALFHCT